MTSSVRRCPKCGGAAATRHATSFENSKFWSYEVRCLAGCGNRIGGFGTEAEAVREWNRKAPSDDDDDGAQIVW